LNDCGVVISAGFINMNPYSTVDRLMNNVDFMREHMNFLLAGRLDTRLVLYRGTSIYNLFKKEGLYDGSYSGENYKYVTQNMDKFVNYILMLTNKLNNNHYLRQLRYFQRYRCILENLKRRFDEPLISSQVNRMKEMLDNSLTVINNMVTACHIELIKLIEKWNDKQANQIIEKYIDMDVLKNQSDKIETGINTLVRFLAKHSEKGYFIFNYYF